MSGVTSQPISQYGFTDDGNAVGFVAEYKDQILYVPEIDSWRRWDGKRWVNDGPSGALHFARKFVRSWPSENDHDRKRQRMHLNIQKLLAIVTLAKSDPEMQKAATDFDPDPYLLNTPSGVLDLKNLTLLPHDRNYLLTRITSVGVIPRNPEEDEWAGMPEFQKFMQFIANNDPDLIKYLKNLFGLCLIGEVREHILPFFYGEGGNGKGTLIELMLGILGTVSGMNYAVCLKEGFLTNVDTSTTFELSTLFGARLAIHPETREGSRFNEARLKQVTGGDSINAAFKHKDEFTFKPTHQMILQGNHRPDVAYGGYGFKRRFREIPFDNQVSEDNMDTELKSKLLMEGERILWWMAEGAKEYLDAGKMPPCQRIRERTEEYAESEDKYQAFLEECCEAGADFRINATDLYKAYVEHTSDTGTKPTVFGKQIANPPNQPAKRSLNGIPITKIKSNGTMVYTGIKLKDRLHLG
ncbi:DNA primase family protein [Nonomuraea sp. SYSU D8015]|uniref:DNA primase family protein n=1 Tax=Nonomuraea sp. SYSU D8015 TaxID=2593644 RepID=UPI00166061FC|nr:phage/plasmid primase, P4 family [Nonomuraea sp. SYSU D8015]